MLNQIRRLSVFGNLPNIGGVVMIIRSINTSGKKLYFSGISFEWISSRVAFHPITGKSTIIRLVAAGRPARHFRQTVVDWVALGVHYVTNSCK